MKPNDAKRIMLLHSEAKVEFYSKYIQRYLRILFLSPYITEINIYDVFCGTGIYDNGKKGSPLVTFDAIKALRNAYPNIDKKINLVVNDSVKSKVVAVQSYIDSQNKNYCNVIYNNKGVDEMFDEIISVFRTQKHSSRNLLFIDPYGYKEIKNATLQALMSNLRTEIILFLPISQMQRFTTVAIESSEKPYEPLKQFVYSFFDSEHPIRSEKVSALDYIKYIKEALRFNKYYSTSYFIERDASSYYALFFITHHILGFEKILEVKWDMDEEGGKGFKLPSKPNLFAIADKQQNINDSFEKLEHILKLLLRSSIDNKQLYAEILRNEFLTEHAVRIFERWIENKEPFQVQDYATKVKARKGSYYLSYEYYNSRKNPEPKAIFSYKK